MSHPAQVQCQQSQHGDLRGEGLGRCHPDLGSGVQVDPPIGLAGNRRADRVTDGQCLVALPPALPHRRQGIGRLPALGDREHHRGVGQRRVAVSQFTRVLDLGRNPGKFLDQVLAHEPGVPAGATGGQDDPVDPSQFSHVGIEPPEDRCRIVAIHPPPHRVADTVGLLVDLLEHVVRKIAEIDVGGLVLDGLDRNVPRPRVAVPHLETVSTESRGVVIVEIDDVAGVSDQGAGVAGQEVLLVADTDDQRTSAAGGPEMSRAITEQDTQAVCALEFIQGRSQGRPAGLGIIGRMSRFDELFEMLADQLGHDLGVGRRTESAAGFGQPRLQAIVVSITPLCTSTTRPDSSR